MIPVSKKSKIQFKKYLEHDVHFFLWLIFFLLQLTSFLSHCKS